MTKKIVVPLRGGSDGDPTHRPIGTGYTEVDPPTLYLEKLAQRWMEDRGEARLGVTYTLERLPVGYALFQKPRVSKPSTIDKWLYGNPEHKYFDSPNRFYPHFLHLMENEGSSIGCPCTVCDPKSSKSGRSTSGFFSKGSSRSNTSASSNRVTPSIEQRPVSTPVSAPFPTQQRGRPKPVGTGMDTSHVDEEGTPDVYRNLIDKLKKHDTLDEVIKEPMSLDWRAEQAILPELLESLKAKPQWVPRVGDIVLYLRDMPEGADLLQYTATGEYRFWDPGTETFRGAPTWQAGLVGQIPPEDVDLDHALQAGEEEMNVSLSGVRVEPMPNPNETNKGLSKRYKYVPVNHTRPFFLWDQYLEHVPEAEWHSTIKNALTVMSTMSLVGKHRFRGQWPDAQIYCHGIYIGAEMLAVGDTVRLLPKSEQPTCIDVLVIKSIRLKLLNLDKSSLNDYDEGRPYNSEVWIFGSAYTTEASRSSKKWLSTENADTPKAAEGYPAWYPLHPSHKELAVPFTRILGRLYEHDVMHQWLSDTSPNALDQGREAVLEGRSFARANDKRLTSDLAASWFWADSRSEALDLQTVNGLEVGRHDADRDPKEWRKKLKIMDGVSSGKDSKEATSRSRNLRAFMAPGTATLPVRSPAKNEESSSSGSSTAGYSRKRELGVDRGEAVGDDEIRQHTRIIDSGPSAEQKKKKRAKVMVLVD